MKICFVLTAEFTVRAFLIEHIRKLSEIYKVTVIVNTNDKNFITDLGVQAEVIPLKIARDISPWRDLSSLFSLIKIFSKEKFSSIHTITPKAGLLGMLAAFVTRVPLRIHTFQGEVWITKTGLIRYILIAADKLVASLSTNIIVVSPSEQDFLISNKIINKDKSIVFNKGSIAGVNLQKFTPNIDLRETVRAKLVTPSNATVFLFLGRLNQDKGILDLVDAFIQLTDKNTVLFLVGPDEQNIRQLIEKKTSGLNLNIHFFGKTDSPEQFIAASDVICLPSYREGFGVSLIEAAAMGVPAIASRIYGITDAVLENETGLLHPPGDVDAIYQCMQTLIQNKQLRLTLANNAKLRVTKDFDGKSITEAWYDFYKDKLSHAR